MIQNCHPWFKYCTQCKQCKQKQIKKRNRKKQNAKLAATKDDHNKKTRIYRRKDLHTLTIRTCLVKFRPKVRRSVTDRLMNDGRKEK